jgi:micrococcal nuclease
MPRYRRPAAGPPLRDRSTRSRLRAGAAIGIALAVAGCALLAQELEGTVTRVVDGDTIEVDVGGRSERIRYIGIDTPEWTDERPGVRTRARAATEANRRLVGGRRVRLEMDVETRDRYGRLLAYVWVGDTLVNEALVRDGHAQPFTVPPNVRYAERFRAAAREAREARASAPGDAGPEPEDSGPRIPSSEAGAHVGERITVCGTVADTRWLGPGRLTFLNLGRPYPDQDLTIVIGADDRDSFPDPPERSFDGSRVCVTGPIELYRGQPQIRARGPGAIRVEVGSS